MAKYDIKALCKVVKRNNSFMFHIDDKFSLPLQNLLEFCHKYRGGWVQIEYRSPRTKRRTGKGSANAHLNGHIQTITMEYGCSYDDVKKRVKEIAIIMGYPILTDCNGVPVLDLWGNVQGISETDSTIEECNMLIDAVHVLAAEMDIILKEE